MKKSPGQLFAEASIAAQKAGQQPPRVPTVAPPAPVEPAPSVPSPGQRVAELRLVPSAAPAPPAVVEPVATPPAVPEPAQDPARAALLEAALPDPKKAQYDELIAARFTPEQAAEMTGYTPPPAA